MQYITTFHEAELNAARVMQGWGFKDAVATTGGADGGIDVSSKAALAQVKWKNGAASRPEIQMLVGARGVDTTKLLFFFAASTYTAQAIEYANTVDVKLFTFDPVGEVTPANKRAQTFVDESPNIDVPARPSLLRTRWFLILLVTTIVLVMLAWFVAQLAR